jgi:hypothetical protein
MNTLKYSNILDTYRIERILTMVYVVENSQNCSGLFPSSCIPKNTTFRKLDLFPSSGVFSPPSPEDGNRSSFRNVVFFGIQKNSMNSLHIGYNMDPHLLTDY